MNPRLIVVAAMVVAGGVAGVLLGTRDKTPSPSARPTVTPLTTCTNAPTTTAQAPWIPDDLPLPEGSRVVSAEAGSQGLQRAFLVVPGTLDDFLTFVTSKWPAEGWKLGKGERERFEAEDGFSRGKTAGQFRARATLCGEKLELLLVIGKGETEPSPEST